jgi:hypothetical protein
MMNSNDLIILKFIELISVAISCAESLKANGAPSDRIDTSIDTLKSFGNLASSGKLPRVSTGEVPKGTGLGLLKGIGEWTEDDELLDAVFKIEEHYKNKM